MATWQPIGASAVDADSARRTSRFLTKYEQTAVLQRRAQQLDLNAPPLVPVTPDDSPNPISIAQRELLANKIDMVIERRMPDDTVEYWNVRELWQPTPT